MPTVVSPLTMEDYTPRGTACWWATFAVGNAVIAWSLVEVSALAPADRLQVIIGLAVATLTGWFPVRIPGSKISVAGCADITLYRAKAEGKGRYAVFNGETDVEVSRSV